MSSTLTCIKFEKCVMVGVTLNIVSIVAKDLLQVVEAIRLPKLFPQKSLNEKVSTFQVICKLP